MVDDGGYQELITLAWREWVTTMSTRGISSESLIGLGHGPPRWFILGELGYAQDQGPSLSSSFARWRKVNAKLLAEVAAEPVRTKKPSANRPVAVELAEVLAAVWRIVRTPHAERFDRPPELDDANDDQEAA